MKVKIPHPRSIQQMEGVMWNNWNEVDRMFGAMNVLRNHFNNLNSDFERPLGVNFGWRNMDRTPLTNMVDNGDHLQIVAEVPGMSKDDLNIKIQGNYLEIGGKREVKAPEGYRVHRSERGATSFTRSFTLPSEINVEKVEASLESGMLTLTLPKAEAARAKQITIN
jgi:HSP20 family protein